MEETKETKDTAVQAATSPQLDLMLKQADAQFSLSPIGQMVKQFEVFQRMGKMYASSSIVPSSYRGDANVSNCVIAVDMAFRMGVTPMEVMQNLYIVNGNPSWSAKFLIARVNACGRFQPLEYEQSAGNFNDDSFGFRCVSYLAGDKGRINPLRGPWVTWAQVKGEGWLNKSGSKWKTMPELMFRYRAAAQWQRTFAPEISMGLTTVEEAQDEAAAAAAVVDVQAVEVPAPAPAYTDEQKQKAYMFLESASKSADVALLKKQWKMVYDNDEDYRDAVRSKYLDLAAAEESKRMDARQQAQQGEQASANA